MLYIGVFLPVSSPLCVYIYQINITFLKNNLRIINFYSFCNSCKGLTITSLEINSSTCSERKYQWVANQKFWIRFDLHAQHILMQVFWHVPKLKYSVLSLKTKAKVSYCEGYWNWLNIFGLFFKATPVTAVHEGSKKLCYKFLRKLG